MPKLSASLMFCLRLAPPPCPGKAKTGLVPCSFLLALAPDIGMRVIQDAIGQAW